MVASSSPAVLKRWIALHLKRLRTEAGCRQQDAANRIGRSQQAIVNIEKAANLPSASDLELLLTLYGVPERIDFFRQLLAGARKKDNWWKALSKAVPKWFDLYLGLEAGAAELTSFDALLVPGLLQTSDYAEATIRADPELSEEEVRQRVELRIGRQQILHRDDDPVRIWAVLDEGVLHRVRGSRAVMAAQLWHLHEMAQHPRINIQVLPFEAGAHLGQTGSFNIMKFPPEMGDPGIVAVDQLVGGHYYEDPAEVEAYKRAMTQLQDLAQDTKDSQTHLSTAAKEMNP
ncbi:helix-turn-helix domain-containing protein [Haloactinomyces albus]|uniref:Transcriptional regulator with XRE-family HTH domain n=1 Tax=Haloactinomyces albus TaxID=1352928 RepID=A0AAE4CMW7_9ACTN|nr:helix-turn-helix transcriptional regulator [Haloactinomyces albus]MDR7303865.1 transcriptional regulator with XRE-family HTH domain [Haloactinomyces albus]